MAKSEQDLEADRRQAAQGPPGGGTSRGPETTTTDATQAQGLVPPYDSDVSSDAKAAAAEGVRKAFNAEQHAPKPGPRPPVSAQESDGADHTDMPMGVGGDRRTGGEELAAKGSEVGREDIAPQSATQRPAGISTGADSTGINPSEGPTHHNEPLTHGQAEDSST